MRQGYVLIEFPTMEEAQAAISGAHGQKLLDQTIGVDYAFVRPPPSKGQQGRGGRGPPAKASRNRSRSPDAKDEKEDVS